MTLAKTHSENGVTLYLLPRLNMRFYRIKDAIEVIYPSGSSLATISIDRFAILEALSLEPFVDAPVDNVFSLYFEQRTGKTLVEKFDLWETLMDIDELNIVYNAYTANREPVLPLELPDAIAADDTKKNDGYLIGSESKSNANETANGLTKSATQPDKTATEPSA